MASQTVQQQASDVMQSTNMMSDDKKTDNASQMQTVQLAI
jgi:hypothetical protein